VELGSESFKIACISWKNLCRIKEESYLGIKGIGKFNKTLLVKWKVENVWWNKRKIRDVLLSTWRWRRDLGKVYEEGDMDSWFYKATQCEFGSCNLIRFW